MSERARRRLEPGPRIGFERERRMWEITSPAEHALPIRVARYPIPRTYIIAPNANGVSSANQMPDRPQPSMLDHCDRFA